MEVNGEPQQLSRVTKQGWSADHFIVSGPVGYEDLLCSGGKVGLPGHFGGITPTRGNRGLCQSCVNRIRRGQIAPVRPHGSGKKKHRGQRDPAETHILILAAKAEFAVGIPYGLPGHLFAGFKPLCHHRQHTLRPGLQQQIGGRGWVIAHPSEVDLCGACASALTRLTAERRSRTAVLVGVIESDDTELTPAANLLPHVTTASSMEGTVPKTSIYQHGEEVSVVTDATEERDFEEGFAQAFTQLIEGGSQNGNRRAALHAAFDIVAKLRGYKSDVLERRMLAAGRWPHPSEKPVAEASGDDATD